MMAWGVRRRVTVVLAATGLVAVPAVVFPGTAEAVAYTGQVTYARRSNTIKLTSGEVDLPTVKSLCPAAPLVETDAATNTWLLMANLLVQNGAVLHMRGTTTEVDPAGAADTLRLLSRGGNSSLEVVNVTSDYGTPTFESTHVTSWDDAARSGAGDVDREPGVGTATPGNKMNGISRAFVRAISRLDPSGAPLESRICSQRCDHLTITGTESNHNGYPVSTPEGDEKDSPQAYGIVIHRGVSDSLIAGNDVHDNNGAGIAVFDSYGNTVCGNTLTNNLFELRSSVGSRDNTYSGNAVTCSRTVRDRHGGFRDGDVGLHPRHRRHRRVVVHGDTAAGHRRPEQRLRAGPDLRDNGRGKTPLVSSSTGVATWTHTDTTGTAHDLTIRTS